MALTVWEPDEHINVIHGLNAQGKTNLLEGIYLVSQCRSFRTRRDSDLVKFGSPMGQVQVSYIKEGLPQISMLRMIPEGNPKRECERNGFATDKQKELVGLLQTVLFTPQHLSIVTGTPQDRRQFLDMAICQLSQNYLNMLSSYKALLKTRTAQMKLLKDQGKTAPDELLEVLTDRLAEVGVQVAGIRNRYVALLSGYVEGVFSDMVGEKERPGVVYEDITDITALRQALRDHYREDILRGVTSFGPHRADLRLTLNGLDMKSAASQGQTRTMALALKLAEGAACEHYRHEPPVYLLDDVFSELDEGRRKYLLEEKIHGQVIITACEPLPIGRVFKVRGGRIVKK